MPDAPEYNTGNNIRHEVRELVSSEIDRMANEVALQEAQDAVQENQIIQEALASAGINIVEQDDGKFAVELPNTLPVQEQVNQDTVGGVSSGTPAPSLTMEDVSNLSPDEINDRWDEISQLMKGSK